MKCQRCGGTKRMEQISAKCNDRFFSVKSGGKEYDGYVPDWCGANAGGDYVNLTICRHCGQVQGNWPEGKEGSEKYKWGKAS